VDRAVPQKIFVRAPNWVGDLVMATPAFARIRSRYMGAEIVCGLRRPLQPILAGSKSFDRYLPLAKTRGPLALWRQARLLRAEQFDLAILFTSSLSSVLTVVLAGIPERVGYRRGGTGALLTHSLPLEREKVLRRHGPGRKPRPMIEHWFALLDSLGMPSCPTKPILRVTPDEEARCAELLRRHSIGADDLLVLLNPGASFGPSKLWRSDRFAAVADRLIAQTGARVLCLAGPGEEDLAREVAARSQRGVVAAVDPLVPLDLLKPLARRAALMVTTDTGPRQFAVAFDVPVVVVMGPTDPRFTANDLERTRVIRHDVPCGPCHLKVCPLAHECMEAVSVDEVTAAALALLAGMAKTSS
jgi:heptosyltransferase-2